MQAVDHSNILASSLALCCLGLLIASYSWIGFGLAQFLRVALPLAVRTGLWEVVVK